MPLPVLVVAPEGFSNLLFLQVGWRMVSVLMSILMGWEGL